MTWLLLVLGVAWGQAEGAELARQQAEVQAAATAVVQARAAGHRRTELAPLMAHYRRAAEALAQMQAAAALVGDTPDQGSAVLGLQQAMVEDRPNPKLRDQVQDWLGEPGARLNLLGKAAHAAAGTTGDLRLGLFQDVFAQAQVLVAACAYDAWQAQRMRDRAQIRARSLRGAGGPGRGGDLGAAREADRLEQAALLAETERLLRTEQSAQAARLADLALAAIQETRP